MQSCLELSESHRCHASDRALSSMSSRPTTNRLWTGQSRTYSRTGQSLSWTAQSRPTTARPQTAVSVINEGSYVIALLEGRGVSREVGIAALDKDTGKVMLVQVTIATVILIKLLRIYSRILGR
jgi:hypothetical protein